MAWLGTALKSSQPMRSASLKSDRPILGMTNGVGTPNTCGSGFTMLSEYCVAMAAVSLLAVAVVITAPLSHAYPPHVRKSRSSRVRQTKFNEKRLRRTNPVATCVVNLARQKQKCTRGSVNCALHMSFVALHHQTIGAD